METFLTNLPVAHRGLHDDVAPENSLSAFRAAIQLGYAVETDVRLSKDGELIIYHDDVLSRLTQSNRKVVESQLRQETMNFNQDLFILVERFCNQQQQLRIAQRADTIAQRRYATNVETFMIGKISTLDLNDSRVKKDQTRQEFVNELYLYWYYYYQLRSLTLWDYTTRSPLETDFEEILRQ